MTYKELFDLATEQFLQDKMKEKDFILIVKLVAKKIKSKSNK